MTADLHPPRIRVLHEVVRNKIAAGEVVERPASVVKELAENALDAGATRVAVELEQGGQRLVRVTDDGCGMDEANLVRAVERHATSKIADVDDIFHITTMGFRGEALPSIGSISRLNLLSAPRDAQTGHQLVMEGGKILRVTPAPPRGGTTVEVRDLFYNTPARRKFLKSASAEVAAIGETITRLALAHPGVGFVLTHNGGTSLDLPPHNSLAERIATLFGNQLAARLRVVDFAAGPLTIEGFAAAPPESRPNSRGVYLFLNRRWIRHPGLARVIADAYRGSLPPRRYPFTVLYLRIDPEQVDVNVHPTKEEVRFENENLLCGSARRAVESALVQSGGFGAPSAPTSIEPASSPPPPASSRFGGPATRAAEPPQTYRAAPHLEPTAGRNIPVLTPSEARERVEPTSTEADGERQQTLPQMPMSKRRFLGQAGEKYLLLEDEEGLLLVDQHALHERWNYEKLQDRHRPLLSQQILTPVRIDLSVFEAARVDEALPLLREFGFALERVDGQAVAVTAHPEIVKPNTLAQVVRDVLHDLEGASETMSALRDKLLASLACRAAVLFGTPLPPAACLGLLEKLEEAKKPLTCPHGRPTTVRLAWDELAARFGRS